MKLQWVRSEENAIIGLAFMRRDFLLHTIPAPAPTKKAEPFWRICDACGANEAMVFCRSHTRYLCEFCLALHNNQPVFCEYLSMTAARELILQRVKNEAHT
jgi:hypothetical protein